MPAGLRINPIASTSCLAAREAPWVASALLQVTQ
jgi:hypothetical protein